jgi:PPP family 3-phenylpropionic acid transporter
MVLFTINNFYLLLISTLLTGIGMTILYPYIETLTMNILKEKYGKSRLYGSLGFIFISQVVSYFSSDYRSIIYVYILATLTFVLISINILNEKTNEQNEDNNSSLTRVSLKFNKKIGFWISVFLVQVSFGAYYNFFTIYENKNGISMETISYLWSFSVICEVIILYFQDYILKINLIKIIKFSILITVLRWGLLFLFPKLIVFSFISQTLHSISFALYYSATILYLYKTYKNNRKIAMLFLSGISYGLGGLVGSLLAGMVYGNYLFLFSSIIAFFGFLVLYLDKEEISKN